MTTQDMFSPNPQDGESFEDLLAVYALGGLDPIDEQALEDELQNAPHLQKALKPYQFVSEALVLAGEPMHMSSQSRSTLMDRVQADAEARFAPAAGAQIHAEAHIQKPAKPIKAAKVEHARETFTVTFFDRLREFFSSPMLSGASIAAALIFAALVGFLGLRSNQLNTTLESQQVELAAANSRIASIEETVEFLETSVESSELEIEELNETNVNLEATIVANKEEIDTLSEERDAQIQINNDLIAQGANADAALVAAEAELQAMQEFAGLFESGDSLNSIILGTEEAPEALAQVVYQPENDVAVLIVDGLAELESGLEYQILLIRGGDHDTADTFTVSTEGKGVIVINAPSNMITFDSIGVSIEPEGGSPQRTGDIVLIGGLNQDQG
ncbi:MAG: anti-sigma factor [Chloroflexota bacterium]